jgi:hypothetical protein
LNALCVALGKEAQVLGANFDFGPHTFVEHGGDTLPRSGRNR